MSELYLPMVTGKSAPEELPGGVPGRATSDEFLSKSHRLMLDLGLIQRSARGLYNMLPVAQMALEKLVKIIDEEMMGIGGQRITMPSLTRQAWWEQSGRWDAAGRSEIFALKDRHGNDFCLGPTHEEAVSMLFAKQASGVGRQRLPEYLYQITPKFRDEDQPRFGLLRASEFLMKDLYSFDATPEQAAESFAKVCGAYDTVFSRLELPVRKVTADVGNIGGSFSQEYHLACSSGQDWIHHCPRCRTWLNREVLGGGGSDSDDTNKGSATNPEHHHLCATCAGPMDTERTLELAHAFILGQRYSKLFNVTYVNDDQTTSTGGGGAVARRCFVEMGCYGIGITRLLAGCIDFCSPSASTLRWPDAIAPFPICIITPKSKSKEEMLGRRFTINLIDSLTKMDQSNWWNLPVLWDDRGDMTVGKRLYQAKKFGWPLVIIGNKTVMGEVPKFEVLDARTGQLEVLSHAETFGFLRSVKSRFSK